MTLRVTPAEIVAAAEASGTPGLLAAAPGWGRVRLGDIARVVNGAPFGSQHFNVAGAGMPLIRIRDVRTSTVSTWYDGPWEPTHLVEPGSLLVGMDGDFNAATWRGPVGLLNQRVCRIDVDTNHYNRHFLEHALQGYLDAIWKATSSTTVKHLSSRSIADIPLPNPALSEQRRIVEILEDHLSRLDAANDYLSAALRRAEHLATTEVWHLTHAVTGGARRRLDAIGEVRLGRQRSPANHQGTRMRPYLRAANVDWNRLRLEDIKEMNFTEAEEDTYRLQPGDILLVEASGSAAEAGKSVVYEGTPADVCFQNTLLRVRCTEEASPHFVQKYLLAEAMAGRFIEGSRGVGINHIGRAKLASLEVALPTLAEQQQRAERCDRALEAAQALRKEIRSAQGRSTSLRRALLAAAFSGRLTGRSSDLDLAEETALACAASKCGSSSSTARPAGS